ncbi:MAG: lipopolysaccharide biosynthesis regulator YciM [Halieaceae bacterium]|jgi:lipopolysaccharide biosynthesis regulator YciM
MSDLALFLLIFSAVGTGWWLGRRTTAQTAGVGDSIDLPSKYYKGLNYLLDDQPDGAIDAFIEALEVNSDTFETHIALGNLLRRKGEVDRAIRIHQNLLARPGVPARQLHQAHLELARDYISAGLLDRAEQLLQDLVRESSEQRAASLKYLLEIYQHQRDWEQAIEVAKELVPRKTLLAKEQPEKCSVLVPLSHFCCELAELNVQTNDMPGARSQLKRALTYDKNCVRASLLLGQLELQTGHPELAVKALKRVRFQDAEFIPETVEPIHSCYSQLDDQTGLYQYLRDCMDIYPSATLMLRIAEDLRSHQGDEAAGSFISQELKSHPSLSGLAALIQLHVANASGAARDNLTLLQQLVDKLIANRPTYRCNHCGFAGKKLHWFCPGCKEWGSIKAIRGTEGD